VIAGGATSEEVGPNIVVATQAYEGLTDVKVELSSTDQRVAAAALSQFRDSASTLGFPFTDRNDENTTPKDVHKLVLF